MRIRVLCGLLVVALGIVGFAQGPVRIRFTLDWVFQGPQAPFLVALHKGYFAQEGLEVTIDRGFGSADAVAKVAGGAYDMGYACINAMIEFNARNPDQALIAIYMILDYAPFSVVTLKDRNIVSPKDLEGRKLGAPAGDASRRLFPVFSKAVGIDPGKVSWVTMDAPLREPLLIKGVVDAISAHFFTAIINLKAAGIPEEDIITFLYAEHGLDLYGNAVIICPKFLQKNPEAVRGFLRALTRAWHDMLANPDEAVACVKKQDPLVDVAVEKDRLLLAITRCMLTPAVWKWGVGDVCFDRLSKGIALVVEALGLPTIPSPDSVFTRDYLPPLEDRLPKIPR